MSISLGENLLIKTIMLLRNSLEAFWTFLRQHQLTQTMINRNDLNVPSTDQRNAAIQKPNVSIDQPTTTGTTLTRKESDIHHEAACDNDDNDSSCHFERNLSNHLEDDKDDRLGDRNKQNQNFYDTNRKQNQTKSFFQNDNVDCDRLTSHKIVDNYVLDDVDADVALKSDVNVDDDDDNDGFDLNKTKISSIETIIKDVGYDETEAKSRSPLNVNAEKDLFERFLYSLTNSSLIKNVMSRGFNTIEQSSNENAVCNSITAFEQRTKTKTLPKKPEVLQNNQNNRMIETSVVTPTDRLECNNLNAKKNLSVLGSGLIDNTDVDADADVQLHCTEFNPIECVSETRLSSSTSSFSDSSTSSSSTSSSASSSNVSSPSSNKKNFLDDQNQNHNQQEKQSNDRLIDETNHHHHCCHKYHLIESNISDQFCPFLIIRESPSSATVISSSNSLNSQSNQSESSRQQTRSSHQPIDCNNPLSKPLLLSSSSIQSSQTELDQNFDSISDFSASECQLLDHGSTSNWIHTNRSSQQSLNQRNQNYFHQQFQHQRLQRLLITKSNRSGSLQLQKISSTSTSSTASTSSRKYRSLSRQSSRGSSSNFSPYSNNIAFNYYTHRHSSSALIAINNTNVNSPSANNFHQGFSPSSNSSINSSLGMIGSNSGSLHGGGVGGVPSVPNNSSVISLPHHRRHRSSYPSYGIRNSFSGTLKIGPRLYQTRTSQRCFYQVFEKRKSEKKGCEREKIKSESFSKSLH